MLLNISPHSTQTLQEQIVGQIRARILSGELDPDEPLPSIRELAKDLRLAVNTVQRAYDHLLREELIYARRGKGYFVAPLDRGEISQLARDRFEESLRKLLDDAMSEGLSRRDLKRVFNQLNAGVSDGEA